MNLFRSLALSTVVLSSLLLTSCGVSLTTSLDLVVSAADVAVTTLQQSGQVSPATAASITNYLNEVTSFVDFTTTELASTDSGATKAAKISQEASMIATPQLPTGTATVIVTVVNAVLQDVASFLSNVNSTSASLQVADSNAFFASGKFSLKISAKEAAKLRMHNASVKVKISKK